MNQHCGCCAGIEIVTPEPEVNRPGLSAIAYRVGTHATFFESMLARLSNLVFEVPSPDGSGKLVPISPPPLQKLTARDPSDFSIALLDAWSAVADVLTFYQERIANEGYLGTATERRSILELARLVGYKLRPGVSASVYLAFTVSDGFSGMIPVGTRAQSIPGTGQMPQFFEISSDLEARDVWNNLKPRLTRPQVITLASDPGTDAGTRETLYFKGIATNLKAGDALLIGLGDNPGQQVLRIVQSVDAQAAQNRTEVALQEVAPTAAGSPQDTISNAVNLFIDEASSIFADSDLADKVAQILNKLLAGLSASTDAQTAADMVSAVIPQVQQQHDIAVQRQFTRLEVWTTGLLDRLNALVQILTPGGAAGVAAARRGATGRFRGVGGSAQAAETVITPGGPPPVAEQLPPPQPSALASLTAIVDKLAKPPSLQPASPQRLMRTVAQTFSPQGDTAPRLLAAFNPAAAKTLYSAWAGVETPSSQVQASAVRAKTTLFASTFAGPPTVTQTPPGAITSVSVGTAGSNYAVGDTGTFVGIPGTGGIWQVLKVVSPMASTGGTGGTVGGIVIKVTMIAKGSGYSPTNNVLTTGGSGSGLTINILTTTPLATTTTVSYTPQNLSNTWTNLVKDSSGNQIPPTAVALDATYDQIKAGSWMAIDRPLVDPTTDIVTGRTVTYHKVPGVQAQSMDTGTGFSAKVTLLTLSPTWLGELKTTDLGIALNSPAVLRGTVVYAQAEPLDLAEEPLDIDVEGDTIELAELYDGLDTGRWIIVSGERTDIPNTTGVTASELVMISGVTQGSRAPLCATFPATDPAGATYIPFAQIYYTTDANAFGDRLIVGELLGDEEGYQQFLKLISISHIPNQQYCDLVQLAPGVYANAYVPTAAERQADFSDFDGLLTDPTTGVPYPGGTIPQNVIGKVFAWRISTQPVHTILTLANKLAYTYDSITLAIYGNVAKATHGQTTGEVLGNGDASQSLQRFALSQSPLTYTAAPTPAGAASTLAVRVNEVEWHEADNLAALGPKDHEYITETSDAGKTTAIFGTGEHGARLPTGNSNVKATYRYGIGAPGNVDANQISQLASQPLGLKGVINPLRASGGGDADTRDQARENAPLGVEALDRLVSVEDYAFFARTFAGIGKASSARLSDGRRLVVHVTIAGANDIPIDPNSDLYLNLFQALHQNGDPYVPIQLALRKLELLVISAGVKVLSDYQWESVEKNIRTTLLATFGFDERQLGQSAFLGEAISAIQAVEGVNYMNVITFDSVREGVTAAQLATLATTLKLRKVVEANLAQVDPTETDPTKRILPAELAILTPDIPDTLILTQITK